MDAATEYRLDASDYIRNVKTVIDGAVCFIAGNPEVNTTPEVMRNVLYDYAKTLWLKRLEETACGGAEEEKPPDLEYQSYCYDYVYDHGNYPR